MEGLTSREALARLQGELQGLGSRSAGEHVAREVKFTACCLLAGTWQRSNGEHVIVSQLSGNYRVCFFLAPPTSTRPHVNWPGI